MVISSHLFQFSAPRARPRRHTGLECCSCTKDPSERYLPSHRPDDEGTTTTDARRGVRIDHDIIINKGNRLQLHRSQHEQQPNQTTHHEIRRNRCHSLPRRLCLLADERLCTKHTPPTPHSSSTTTTTTTTALFAAAKGFGEKPKKPVKTEAAVKREQESSQYDKISSQGGQEYRVFVRQFGSDDESWLPCGAVAVPRGAQVSDAIFANQEALNTSIVRTYPKLAGFEEEFEFGFNLKVYPDDPVEVASKNKPRAQGLSIGNWISTLLSPVDASAVPPPPIKE